MKALKVESYYYQKIPADDKYLPGKWACCGIVSERTITFYVQYLRMHDPRGANFEVKEPREIKIVEGYRGNTVAVLED